MIIHNENIYYILLILKQKIIKLKKYFLQLLTVIKYFHPLIITISYYTTKAGLHKEVCTFVTGSVIYRPCKVLMIVQTMQLLHKEMLNY